MKIERYIIAKILDQLVRSDKAIIIYGPRQVGKTTLCQDLIGRAGMKTLYINADEGRFTDVLGSRDARALAGLVGGYELVVIDEAQRVPDIGINLKILIDAKLGIKIIATGSSSFELSNKINEPLTGRHWTYLLYPISQLELRARHNEFELNSLIEERLRWGSYPGLFSIRGANDRESYLRTLASDYLYKDIFTLQDVRNAAKIRDLLKLLAFQVGSQVSLSELASHLEMSKETVARYIDLLEKTFVLFRLSGFSRNLRKEISKTHKYYFFDLGIRNAVIDNFKPLSLRNDAGALWENFLIMERIKRNSYLGEPAASYFWRTYTGAEIDYVEERGGALTGYEFTWGKGAKKRMPPSWGAAYPNAHYETIDQENYFSFVT